MSKRRIIQFFKADSESFRLAIIGFSCLLLFAPFYFFFLGFIVFPYFAYSLYKAKTFEESFKRSFYFLFGFFLGNFYWISFSFLVNKNFILLFPFVFLLIPAAMAFFSALFLASSFFIKQKYKLSLLEYYFIFALILFLHEFLRGHFIPMVDFKGLPWVLLGYSFFASDNLVQFASVVGVYGLTFIVIYLYLSPIFFYEKKYKDLGVKLSLLFLLSLVFLHSYGVHKKKSFDLVDISDVTLALVHTNTARHHAQTEEGIIANVNKAVDLIKDSENSDIYIIPEGAVSIVSNNNYNQAFEYIIEEIAEKDFDRIIVGSPRAGLKDGRYYFYNSIFNLDNNHNFLGYYDKTNLVPFGEYNPYTASFPSVAASKNFSKGDRENTILKLQENLWAVPLICYDGIFPGKFSQDGDFLLNITNDIWFTRKLFGRNISVGPWQHFDLIRMRSIEEGKPLIRVANYGVTAVVDSFGEVKDVVDFNDSEQVLKVQLPAKLAEPTIYNQYRDLIVYLVVILNLLAVFNYFLLRKN